jgi:hypothetical protein
MKFSIIKSIIATSALFNAVSAASQVSLLEIVAA